MPEPKLHHYVPRFYLRGFADRDRPRSVWVYENGVAAPRCQGIANTAAETQYYTITTPGGQRENFLETEFLAPIESAAAPIIEHLRSGAIPEVRDDAIEPLASFLTASYARSPHARSTHEKLFVGAGTAVVKNQMRSDREIQRFLDEHPDFGATKDELKQVLQDIDDPSKWRLSLRRDLKVALQFRFIARFFRYFADKNYSVLTCSGDPEFITCDSPVSVFVIDDQGRALVGVGIGQPNVEIVLTLSPTRALRLTNAPQPVRQRVSKKVVHDINRRLVYQADRFVYASRNAKRIAQFVSGCFEKRHELAVDPVAMAAYMSRFKARKKPTTGD